MKLAKIASLLSMIVLFAGLAQAQIAVDPNNDSCWNSLTSLRACQKVEVERAAIQAQQCTSFPEYQCTPDTSTVAPPVEVKKTKKSDVMGAAKGFQPHTDDQVVVKPAELLGNQR